MSDPSKARREFVSAAKLETIAGTHTWTWPLISVVVGLVSATTLAIIHYQLDLGTYLLGGQHVFRPDLYAVADKSTGLGFTYPPFAALWFVPLSHLPERLAQVLFTWVSLGAILVVIATSLRATCPALQRRTVAWWSLLLVTPVGLFDPLRETIILGQVNILLAAAVIVDMTVIRPGSRGYLVGIAAAIKITPLILIPYLLFTQRGGAWRRATLGFVAAAGIGFVAAPHSSWRYWSHEVWTPGRAGDLAWLGNQGLIGVVRRFHFQPINNVVTFVLISVIVVLGLSIAVRTYRRSSPVFGFLVIEATESLASPVSWSHHFVWIVLLIAWLALGRDRPVHGPLWAAAVALIFWAAPIWWVPQDSAIKYAQHGLFTVLADSFFLTLCVVPIGALKRLIRHPEQNEIFLID